MRTIKLAAFVSLDGVMQAPGGPEEDPSGGFAYGGWIVPFADEAMGAAMLKAMGDDFDLLLGRRTYEIFAAHWPLESDAFAERLNGARKHVAARPDEPLDWTGSERLGDDVAAAVATLKQGDGKPLLIQGSATLVHTLLAADLIDEITTLTFPVILGGGKRLFPAAGRASAWRVVGSAATPGGAIVTRYLRDGELTAGSFAHATPTPAETARRARLAREDR